MFLYLQVQKKTSVTFKKQYISYFSIAIIKSITKNILRKKVYFGLGFQMIRVLNGREEAWQAANGK